MANVLSVLDIIARESLRYAHEKSSFLSTIDLQYDSSFEAQGGWKPGQVIRVANPNRYTRTQGSRAMDVQDQGETTQTISLATQDHVAMRFNSSELALKTNDPREVSRFSKRYIEPAMGVLISGIEGDVLAGVTKQVYNQVGTWGTPPTSLLEFGDARARLNQDLAPKDGNRYLQYDSVNMSAVVNGLSGKFQDATQIKEQYREGMVGRTAGFDWYENERIYSHTTGSDHTSVTVNDTSLANGDTVITTAGATVTVGTVFTIANVNKVHPETKASYARAQQFVITAVSGNDWTISPAIYASGARQNVDALPVNGAAITLVGTASQTKQQALAYHKEAFQFVTAPLPLMDDAFKCVRMEQDGISMRVWIASDIRLDELLCRIDILYGYAALRPEWACRVTM